MPTSEHVEPVARQRIGPIDIVVLVHGTWGRGVLWRRSQAAWCDSGSPICSSISAAFPNPPRLIPFAWSGRNSLSVRARTARELREFIASIIREAGIDRPRLHIVAHSHAGNIACYALRDPETRMAVASLTCLSTPFLQITARPVEGRIASLLRSGLAWMVFVLVFYAVTEAYFALSEERFDGKVVALVSGAVAVLFALWIKRSQQSHTARITRSTELPKGSEDFCRTLILRAPSDEASVVLSMVQLMSNVLTRLASLAGLLVPSLRRHTKDRSLTRKRTRLQVLLAGLIPLAAFCTSALEAFPAAIWLGDDSSDFVTRLLEGTALFTAIYWLVAVLLVMFGIGLATIALGILLVPFGPGLAMFGWGLHVSAEASPPGSWRVVQLEASDEDMVSHATHSNPAAISLLKDWLRQEFGGLATTSESHIAESHAGEDRPVNSAAKSAPTN